MALTIGSPIDTDGVSAAHFIIGIRFHDSARFPEQAKETIRQKNARSFPSLFHSESYFTRILRAPSNFGLELDQRRKEKPKSCRDAEDFGSVFLLFFMVNARTPVLLFCGIEAENDASPDAFYRFLFLSR